MLSAAAKPAVAAEQRGFLHFLFAPSGPVAARDPRWSYTVERELDQPPANATVTGSLPPAGSKPAMASRRKLAKALYASEQARGGSYHASTGPTHQSITGPAHTLAGLASFYWQPQMTANGEVFDPRQMTAAHKTLPFGTKVRVTDVRTGRSVVVRINDRGPYKPGRIIDLSQAAAQSIGMASVGITPVKLDIVGR